MNRCPAASGGPRLSRYGSLTSLTGRLESTQERTFLDGMPNGQIDLSDTLDGAYVIKKS
jgi:hypothetical protein